MKKINKNKTKGRIWVGRWLDGMLGWGVPCFVNPENTNYPDRHDFVGDDEVLSLCEVEIKIVKDKLGRPITRRMKTFRKNN